MADAAHNQHSETRRPSDRDRIVTTGPTRFQPARPEVLRRDGVGDIECQVLFTGSHLLNLYTPSLQAVHHSRFDLKSPFLGQFTKLASQQTFI